MYMSQIKAVIILILVEYMDHRKNNARKIN
jgi:hypothetical protein